MRDGKFGITVSRPTYGDGRKMINVTVIDNVSRIKFLDIEIEYSKFAELITGLGEVQCDGGVKGLDRVGKTKERKEVILRLPDGWISNRKEIAIELVKEHLVDGYIEFMDFNSQNSFFTEEGVNYARTYVHRWV